MNTPFPSCAFLSQIFWENTCAGNSSECSKQSLRVLQAHSEQVQAECLRRVLVPDPATGRWKRSRPEHAEGTAQPVKDPPDEEDHLPQTSRKASGKCRGYTCQRRAPVAEPQTNWQSDSEASMIAPVHWPVACRNPTSPARQIRVSSKRPSACFTDCWGGTGRRGSSDATVTRRSSVPRSNRTNNDVRVP